MNPRFSFLAAPFLALAGLSVAADVTTLEVGASAPNFDLPGIDDQNHTLGQYADADVLAVLFTCNHCPTAQAVESRVISIVEDYADQSFQLVAISPNNAEAVRLDELGYSMFGDSLEDMKLHAEEQGFNFPYLYDGETQDVSKAYGAVATPQIFIFDKERKLQYVGRVDDSRYADGVEVHDARNAIDALLAGEPVEVATTRAFGCSTKWAAKIDQVAEREAAWNELPVLLDPIDAEFAAELKANDTDKLRLVNFWASWCGPCVEEFPHFVELSRQFQSRGFDFISIAMDGGTDLSAAQELLEEFQAATPPRTQASLEEEGRTTQNYFYMGTPDDLGAAMDPEWQGPIPHTILIAPGGEIIHRQSGEADFIELKRAILGHLGRFYTRD